MKISKSEIISLTTRGSLILFTTENGFHWILRGDSLINLV